MSLEIDPSIQGSSIPLEEASSSFCTKISRGWQLIVEVIFKELGSVFTSIINRIRYYFNPNKYNLNPKNIICSNQSAKVIILLHGQGGGPYCLFPMAKELEKQKIPNVFTVQLETTGSDLVPLKQLDDKIDQIKKQCLEKGIDKLEFALIGHSLGALVASKKIWRGNSTDTKIAMMIALGGRLRYEPNSPFSWLCDEKDEVNKTYNAFKKEPHLVDLYTIRGKKDNIVPNTSAHIQNNPEKEVTIPGYAHGGIIHSPKAISKVVLWTQKWRQEQAEVI